MQGFSFRITFAKWLPLGVIIVGAIGFAYLGLQQLNRAQMNDPQIQMVEDAVAELANGAQPSTIVPATLIDARQSLAPWIGIYDSNGKPVSGDVVLDGTVPVPPAGVFAAALANGEDRVTWQPAGTARIALVVRPVPNSNGWFVASGRSMREGESRIDVIGQLALLATLLLLIATLGLEVFGAWRHARQMARQQQQQPR